MENLKLYEVRYTLGDFFRGGRYLLGASAKDVYDFIKAWQEEISDVKAEEVRVVQGVDGSVAGDYLLSIKIEREIEEQEMEGVPRDTYNEKEEARGGYIDKNGDKLRFYRAVYNNPNKISCHEYLVGRNAKQIYEHIQNDEEGKALRGEASDIQVEEVRTEMGIIGREYGFFVFDAKVDKRLEVGAPEPEAEVYNGH